MRWNDRIFTGTYGKWSWLVVLDLIDELLALTKQHHVGQRLCITAFDSGPITPGPAERSIGWTLIGDAMVSPPLTPELDVPCDENDEWYVFPSVPASIDVTNRYVNICGFTLADPHALTASQDPKWDRANYDWLVSLQRQFWSDTDRLDPSSYISNGDADVVVTRNRAFFEHVLDAARKAIR